MLTDQELDEVYTQACYTMTEVGEAKTPALSRSACALADERGRRREGGFGRRSRRREVDVSPLAAKK